MESEYEADSYATHGPRQEGHGQRAWLADIECEAINGLVNMEMGKGMAKRLGPSGHFWLCCMRLAGRFWVCHIMSI